MCRRIATDPIVIAAAAIVLLQLAVYSLPILTEEQFDLYSNHFFDLPFRLLLIAALLYRMGEVTAPVERRFWRWIVIAFASWFVGQSLFTAPPGGGDFLILDLLHDLVLFSLYPLLLIALLVPPDRAHVVRPTRELLLHPSSLLCAALFTYFVLASAFAGADSYVGAIPSYCSWVIMDALLAVRLARLHGSSRDARWRSLYGLLALAMTSWMVVDFVELLMILGTLQGEWGIYFDLAWHTPYLLVIAAACVRRHSSSETARDANNEVTEEIRESGLVAPLIIYGLFIPVTHAGLFALNWLEDTEAPRQIVGFAVTAVLVTMILWRRSAARRADPTSGVTVFVTDAVLQESQRMESLGRLAGGVAHDFNNMLLVIRGYGDLLQESLTWDPENREYVREIHKAVDRAASMTQQLLAFSKRQMLRPVVVDMNAAIEDTGSMLRRLIGEDIVLEVRPSPLPCPVRLDRTQLAQIVVNLTVNARDAMPEGGHLLIETAAVELTHVGTEIRDGDEPIHGPHVLLKVTDDGVGMDPETRARLFEPFFTRSLHGAGTGLGLATVYGIVRQSGGFIAVTSKLGEGTTFDIYFPRGVETPADPEPQPKPTPAQPGSGETILIAEDEESVREMTRGFLLGRGYRVLEASTGMEAVRICEDSDDSIDLLLTDVVMPELGGRELVERAKLSRPELKVLYVSGYPEDGPCGSRAFLGKPFSLDELENRIREVLRK